MAKKKVNEETVVVSVTEEKKEPEMVTVVNCENLRIRETPSTTGLVIEIVPNGTELIYKNKVNTEWTHIQTVSGKHGYVMNKFISRK